MDSKKNILVVTRWFPNIVEPVKCVFTKNIIDAQAASKNYSYTIISPIPYFPNLKIGGLKRFSKFCEIPFIEKMGNYTVYRPKYFKLPFSFFKRVEWYFYLLSVLRTIKMVNIRFSLIHAHGIYPDGLVALKTGKYFKKRVILHAHESYIGKYSNRRFYAKTLEGVDEIIPVSHFQARQIYKINPKWLHKCRTVYNGVKLTASATKKISHVSPKVIKLLFVGHLNEEKGLDLLLIALKDLKQCNLSLDIIGVGMRLSEYKKIIKRYSLAEKVVFLGEVNNKEVLQKMSTYDFLISPSRYETFGVVLIEAMSCGVPVVATRVGAIPEVITNEDVGIVVAPNNPGALAEGIKRAFKKKWDREKIKKYAEKFSIEKTAAGIEEVYKKLLAI
ncbi:glycosyltransferase [bacterium]|nr:glycosyltransferase [bacterium]